MKNNQAESTCCHAFFWGIFKVAVGILTLKWKDIRQGWFKSTFLGLQKQKELHIFRQPLAFNAVTPVFDKLKCQLWEKKLASSALRTKKCTYCDYQKPWISKNSWNAITVTCNNVQRNTIVGTHHLHENATDIASWRGWETGKEKLIWLLKNI